MKTIGLCALSHVASHERYDEVIEAISDLGYTPFIPKHFYNDDRGFLPSIETRIEDFNALLYDSTIDLIHFSGGDGCNEILPGIDYHYFKAHPKKVMGYSDATYILNALYANTNQMTYYGPGTGVYVDKIAYNLNQVQDLLNQKPMTNVPIMHHQTILPGTAKGTLIGGYLGIFNLLLGSPYFNLDPKKDFILFIEDHYFYHDLAGISAQLSYLTQHPFSKQIKAIIFGNYGREEPLLLKRLEELGRALKVPIMQTNDFGHEAHHAIIPIGSEAVVDTVAGTIQIL